MTEPMPSAALAEPEFEDARVYGHGGDWPRGWWSGHGTSGRMQIGQGPHGFRAYWWYVGLNGEHRGLEWCSHRHQSTEASDRCAEREAARRNRALRRVRGEVQGV